MSRRIGYSICVVVLLGMCGALWGQTKAVAPNPPDGALDVIQPLFRWTPGQVAMFHNVYLGTAPELGPEHLVAERQILTLYWHTPGIAPGTTYYWRVDEIESDGVTVHTGDVWTFLARAMTAYYPNPADGDNVTPLAPDLTWLAGQGAVKHHVYFSDSETAVTDGAPEADKGIVEALTYSPGELQPISTYYWRVDEVGLDDTELAGNVWSFTTILPVDDFEGYGADDGSRIYEAWTDGWANSTGSRVGYLEAPFEEQTIVHGGQGAMPLFYDNAAEPWYSETEFDFGAPQDWTVNDAGFLTLHIRGQAADFTIPIVTTPPVLDGTVDEIWGTASDQYIGIPISNEPDGPEDSSGSFRALYDSEYLYVLVDVRDEVLVQDSDPAQGWLDDRIEVFIDGDNSKDSAQDGKNDYQYCFRWNHGAVEIPVEWYLSPGSLQGVEYAVVTTDSGYLFEIKLSWSTMIGGPPEAGQSIGIDVMVGDDDDGGDRDSQLSWHLPSGDPHVPSMWGTALLAETATGGTDVVYVALQDTSNRTAVLVYPDPEIMKRTTWTEWEIPLSTFVDAGVDPAAVRRMFIGVGDRDNPKPGDAGLLFIDDIYLTKPAPSDADDVGLVAYYPFENSVEDTSGNSLHGTASGAPVYAEGLPGYGMAMDFDGTDDVVELGQFDVVGEITLAAWIKPDDFGINDARIISKAKEWGGNDHWWMVSTISETSLRFRLKTDDGEETATLVSDPVLEVGVWTHVAATWDGSMMRIYKNGAEVASQEKGGSAVAVDPVVPVAIGSQPSDAFAGDPSHVVKFFDGLIDEVGIYDRALSAAEILELAGM